MNSEKTALLGFQLAKFVMMLGTAAMVVLITKPLVADLPGWVQGFVVFFVVSVIVLLLDGGGWDFVVDAGRALNKQDHVRPKPLATWLMLLFGLGLIFGSAFLSVMTSPILSRVTTADKSGEAERLERVQSQAQANYLTLLQNSSKNVERAEAAYNEAKARHERREKDAPAAVGGKLGQELRDGNAWARKQKPYTSFIAGREKEYKDALATLAQAQQAHNALVARGFQDETTQAVVDGIGVVLDDWQTTLSEKKNIFFGIQIAACAVAFFFAFLLFQFHALPNDRTILQVGRDLALTISNAVVLALDFGQVHASRAIEEKTQALHLVPPGSVSPPRRAVPPASVPPVIVSPPPVSVSPVSVSCPPCTPKSCPPATGDTNGDTRVKYTEGERRRLDKIKGYIKTYRKRGVPPKPEWIAEKEMINRTALARKLGKI